MWIDNVLNPQIIKSLFKDESLSLERITMREIKLITGDDLICTIAFDLEHYLKNPPIKWTAKAFNKVQMQFSFIKSAVSRVDFDGGILPGTLSIEHRESHFEVDYLNHHNSSRLSLKCKWIHIDKVEGYCQKPDM